MKTLRSLTLAAIAAMSLSASAGVITLVSPKEGETVVNPGHFPDIHLKYGGIENVQTLTMSSEAGGTVDCPLSFDMTSYEGIVDCSGVTESGKWTLTIPAGAIIDDDETTNELTTFTWDYKNEGEVAPISITGVISGGTGTIAPGGTVETTDCFPNITLKIGEYGATVNKSTLSLTSDKGYYKNVDVNTTFYDNQWDQSLIVKSGDEKITESAVYTLHIPDGWLTKGGTKSEAAELSWTYKYTGGQSGGDEKELVLKSLTINGTDLIQTHTLATMQADDAIEVKIDPIPEAIMLTLSFTDDEDNIIREFEIYNRDTNKDVIADPENGIYKTVVAGAVVNKFLIGTDYKVTVNGYSTNNVKNPANKVYGPKVVEFTGATEPYKFSSAKLVSVTPELNLQKNFEVTDPTQPIIYTFSEPVNMVKAVANEGGQGGADSDMTAYTTSNADKTVWTIRPGRSFWESCESTWMFRLYAKGADDGLVVEGNDGVDENSCAMTQVGCYLAYPTFEIQPASGVVEELHYFTVENSKGVSVSYTAQPYILNDKDEVVAKFDLNSQVRYNSNGVDISTLGWDVPDSELLGVKSVVSLDKPITEPGVYKLIIPTSSYNFGEQYEGYTNGPMQVNYMVMKMPVVNVTVEMVNFATVTVPVLEDRAAAINLQPAADWKLASLTLNDEDVTADVKDNVYTLEGIKEAVSLKAIYEYAHEVTIVETTGVGEIETDGKTVKVYNEGENIVIEGVAEGTDIKVYTANGMNIASVKSTQDTVKVSAPQEQIYVVLVGDKAIKIKH